MPFDPTAPSEDITPTGLPEIDKPVNQNEGIISNIGKMAESALTTPLPGVGQSASQLITTPQRGLRGVGVGIENLMNNVPLDSMLLPGGTMTAPAVTQIVQNAPRALERAAAAIDPAYRAAEGEKLGSLIGEAIGSAPLAAATGGAAPGTFGLAAKVGLSAISGATMSAIEQASREGNIKVMDMGIGATAGAAVPLISPTLKLMGNVLFGVGPTVASKVGVKPFAIEELRENPNLLTDFIGTAEAVDKKVVGIQKSLSDIYETAADDLGKMHKAVGLPPLFEDGKVTEGALEAIEAGKYEARDIDDLIGTYRFLKKNNTMSAKAKIRSLVELRQDIGRTINYKPNAMDQLKPISNEETAILKGVQDDINSTIYNPETKTGLGEFGKKFRAVEEAYHHTRSLRDALLDKLANKDKAAISLARITYNDNLDELIGTGTYFKNLVQELEKKSGKQLWSPLRKEMAAKAFNEMKPPGVLPPLERPGYSGSAVGTIIHGGGKNALKNTVQTLDYAGHAATRLSRTLSGRNARAGLAGLMSQIAAALSK